MTFLGAKQHVETVREIPEFIDQPKKAVLQVDATRDKDALRDVLQALVNQRDSRNQAIEKVERLIEERERQPIQWTAKIEGGKRDADRA